MKRLRARESKIERKYDDNDGKKMVNMMTIMVFITMIIMIIKVGRNSYMVMMNKSVNDDQNDKHDDDNGVYNDDNDDYKGRSEQPDGERSVISG